MDEAFAARAQGMQRAGRKPHTRTDAATSVEAIDCPVVRKGDDICHWEYA